MLRKLSVLSFFALPLYLLSLPNGNPSSPLIPEEGYFISKESIATLELAYEGDWTFERNIKFTRDKDGLRDKFSNFYMQNQSARASVNFADRVELHFQFGDAKLQFSQLPNSTTKIDYTTNSCFSYGAFTNILLAYWGQFDMGINAGYLHFASDMHRVSSNGAGIYPTPGKFSYDEWVVGLGFSYKMPIFTPYAGINYSSLLLRIKKVEDIASLYPYNKFNIQNKQNVGIFLGCSIAPFRGFALNVEARVVDQIALTVNGKFRF